MGLPVEINPLLISSSGYVVGRSLRFRSSASAYLNRTFGAPTNGKIWTYSVWVKRGLLDSTYRRLIYSATNGDEAFRFTSSNTLEIYFNGYTSGNIATTQVFRDPSAWYHLVLAIDTTQATASNRVKFYVNGTQITALSATSYPAQNYVTSINAAGTWYIANQYSSNGEFFDGYFAEVNFVDGQALTPTSFGAYDTNGVWQPLKYGGTYGTNGFYLPFSDTTSTTTLCYDKSGNGNNWTPNNISLTAGTTYDSMIDSPTNAAGTSTGIGNYCTWNPNWKDSTLTISDGNLKVSSASNSNGLSTGTIAVSSGKWYWEATVGGSVSLWAVGIISTSVATPNYTSLTTGNSYAWNNGAQKYNGQTASSYGATYTTGDVLGVALDLDGGTLTFYKNNVSQGTAFTGVSGTFTPMSLMNASSDVSTNFGQRPFSYTPPTGYSALNTYNLPTPTIANGANYMAATLWTGNGTSQSIANSQSNGGNNPLGKSFYPDFVWYKGRTTTYNHALFDTIRGTLQRLSSNLTSAETTTAGSLTAFNSNGFSIGNDAGANQNTDTYVGWQWLAGAGSSSSNTSGSITSTVSVNTTAGFSIVTYTGTGANATVGHGLGVAPSMVIYKVRSQAYNWMVYHVSVGATAALNLNLTAGPTTASTWFNNTAPTSSVLSIGTDSNVNQSSQTYVAYCFAAVRGYSAFGSYTGNGSSDGPFIYTGFRPRWIMVKMSSGIEAWLVYDSSRNTYNITNLALYPNASTAETTETNNPFDLLSNGFKLRGTGSTTNTNASTYIYAAFAENPFNYSRAR